MKWKINNKLELLTLSFIVLFIAAFAYVSSSQNHAWGGADGQAEDVISQLTGGTYIPWIQSIYKPPSSEIESLLFAIQAAAGSLIIGYFLGYYRALARIRAGEAAPKEKGKQHA
jgi:cobalt/nickel transport protein